MTDSVPPRGRRRSAADSQLDSGSILKGLNQPLMSRWIGWRLRILALLALIGCPLVLLLAQGLAALPYVGGEWIYTREGQLELRSTTDSRLAPQVGKRLSALSADGMSIDLRDASLVQRSARWLTDDAQRLRQTELHRQIAAVMAHPACTLTFESGDSIACAVRERGFGSLPAIFWVLTASALMLYLVGMVVLLVRPSQLNLLYATVTLCQAGNLVVGAIQSALDLGIPASILALDFPARAGFDVFTAAAMIHVVSLHPLPLPKAKQWSMTGWAAALAVFAGVASGLLSNQWFWVQTSTALMGLLVIALLVWSYRLEPRPLALTLGRLGVVTVGGWILLTVALVATGRQPWSQANIAAAGTLLWYFCLGGLLLMMPFLSRTQQIMREFALLAAITALAALLDLVFVGVFSFNQFSADALSVFIALGVYVAARQWLVNRLLGASMTTTERMFEQLYRIAREVEAQPERAPVLLAELLSDLFDPVDIEIIQDPVSRTRITNDGSTLMVPIPALAADEQGLDGAIVLRFAQRGNRLFTSQDMRLTDRIVEQLERAVAYDRAVERGRSEERLRLAQDLHDDIGARLLTLIYKAQSPDMEEYARRTLQDLKTLTRGLAASSHRLSHAVGEWKADLTHRLSAANIELAWSCEFDTDPVLSVVQWSAFTRVLRELVSNAIAHSTASRVEVAFRLEADVVQLNVSDDGSGRDPKNWSHGLGLGGVRKRVKQLNGQVVWSEVAPRGISCRVTVRDVSKHR